MPFNYEQLTDTAEFRIVRKLIAGKSIVAVGEVTHGTRQVDQLQAKIARDLCGNHGFRVIVLGEIYTATTIALNRYVLFNEGTLADALEPIATNQGVVTAELIELTKWVNKENQRRSLANRIWLVGTEVAPPKLLEDVAMHLKKPSKANDNQITADTNSLSRALIDQWVQQLAEQHSFAIDIFQNNKEALREVGIFQNIQWLKKNLQNPKVIIIDAHNGHVEKQPCYYSDMPSFIAIKRVGHFLYETYPDQYVVIGTELQRGYFDRGEGGPVNRVPEHKRKLGTILGKLTNSPYGLLELRKCKENNLLPGNNYRMSFGTSNQTVGSVAKCNKIADAFDGLIFIRESVPDTLIYSLFPAQAFSVYFNLNKRTVRAIVAAQQLKVKLLNTHFELTPDKESKYYIRVYMHDIAKKMLRKVDTPLTTDSTALCLNVPASTVYISMHIVGNFSQGCRVGEAVVNNHTMKSAEWLLIDVQKHYKLITNTKVKAGFEVITR